LKRCRGGFKTRPYNPKRQLPRHRTKLGGAHLCVRPYRRKGQPPDGDFSLVPGTAQPTFCAAVQERKRGWHLGRDNSLKGGNFAACLGKKGSPRPAPPPDRLESLSYTNWTGIPGCGTAFLGRPLGRDSRIFQPRSQRKKWTG
jgi:hypothetical protein